MRVHRFSSRLAISGSLTLVAVFPIAGRAAIPDLAVSEQTKAQAPLADTPIDEVTVYSDRARVRRRGRVRLGKTAALYRLPDLPGAAFLDTVRVAVEGARVLRVEANPVARERFDIEPARKLLAEVDAIDVEIAAVADRMAAADWERRVVTNLQPALPVTEDKREGRKALTVDTAAWMKAMDFLAGRRDVVSGENRALGEKRRVLDERRAKLQEDIARLNLGGFAEQKIEVVAVMEGSGADSAQVELEYFVPGGFWKPGYDLQFSPARGRVRLETAAAVVQATGEDWREVKLFLSTATPGRGVDLPELLTWTLGERDDWLPVARPVQAQPAPQLFAAPAVRVSSVDEARSAEIELLRQRLAMSAVPGGTLQGGKDAGTVSKTRFEGEVQGEVQGDVIISGGLARPSRRPMQNRPAPAPPESVAAPEPAMEVEAEESFAEEKKSMSGGARPAMARPRPSRGTRRAADAPAASMSLALFEPAPISRRPQFTDSMLPAVSAGGLDYVYEAATRVTIESTGTEVRVPLSAQDFSTTAFYEATPSLTTTAFLKARVRNDGKRPVLRGIAQISVDGEWISQGELDTTGPGGDLHLPLGADQDIRLQRKVIPSTKTTGLLSKTDETVYAVELQIGNYKKQAITVDVFDQMPKTGNQKVEIKWLDATPKPADAMDADGVVRWRVKIAAGKTETIRFRYRVERPAAFRLFQR